MVEAAADDAARLAVRDAAVAVRDVAEGVGDVERQCAAAVVEQAAKRAIGQAHGAGQPRDKGGRPPKDAAFGNPDTGDRVSAENPPTGRRVSASTAKDYRQDAEAVSDAGFRAVADASEAAGVPLNRTMVRRAGELERSGEDPAGAAQEPKGVSVMLRSVKPSILLTVEKLLPEGYVINREVGTAGRRSESDDVQWARVDLVTGHRDTWLLPGSDDPDWRREVLWVCPAGRARRAGDRGGLGAPDRRGAGPRAGRPAVCTAGCSRPGRRHDVGRGAAAVGARASGGSGLAAARACAGAHDSGRATREDSTAASAAASTTRSAKGHSFRAGIDYGGNVHVTVGMSFRFQPQSAPHRALATGGAADGAAPPGRTHTPPPRPPLGAKVLQTPAEAHVTWRGRISPVCSPFGTC